VALGDEYLQLSVPFKPLCVEYISSFDSSGLKVIQPADLADSQTVTALWLIPANPSSWTRESADAKFKF
jgi:hypothetical protein